MNISGNICDEVKSMFHELRRMKTHNIHKAQRFSEKDVHTNIEKENFVHRISIT